jgi:hypothetical protein
MSALALAVAALFAGLVLFQAALAAGAPIGHLAWGGRHSGVLPRRLRLASAASIAIAVAGVVAALAAGGWLGWPRPATARVVLLGLAALFALSLAGNLASSSPAERRLGVPLAGGLLLGCAALGLAGG